VKPCSLNSDMNVGIQIGRDVQVEMRIGREIGRTS
jgi:hypothetical protein